MNYTPPPKIVWYAAYTPPKSEKKAALMLDRIGVDYFLPIIDEVRQWSDRKKTVSVPLFPNYIFIHTAPRRRFDALQLREIIRYVSMEGAPCLIEDEVIEAIRSFIQEGYSVKREVDIPIGTPVEIIAGHMAGYQGILTRVHNSHRLIIELEALRQSISVEMPREMLRPLSAPAVMA